MSPYLEFNENDERVVGCVERLYRETQRFDAGDRENIALMKQTVSTNWSVGTIMGQRLFCRGDSCVRITRRLEKTAINKLARAIGRATVVARGSAGRIPGVRGVFVGND